MRFSDLLAKLAQNKELTPQELDQLKIYGNDTEQRNSFVAGNTTAQGTLDIKFPFMPIFSEKFEVDKVSVTVPIPQDYNHLLIFSNGRTTTAGTGGGQLVAQFNGDTAENYGYQDLYGSNATVTASWDLTRLSVSLGIFARNSNPAGESASNLAIISNYRSSFHKQVMILEGRLSATTGFSGTEQSVWLSTAAIQSINIFAWADNILAGSIISIYGIL